MSARLYRRNPGLNNSKLLLSALLAAVLLAPAVSCRGGIHASTTTAATIIPPSSSGAVPSSSPAPATVSTGNGLTFTMPWQPPSGTSLPYLTFYNDVKYDNQWMWIRPEADNTVRIGITDYGQAAFGAIWQVILPAIGDTINRGFTFGFIQGEDTMDVNLTAPVSGTVLDVNQDVLKDHNLINTYPYGSGWLVVVRMSHPADLDLLLAPAEYARLSLPPCHCNN